MYAANAAVSHNASGWPRINLHKSLYATLTNPMARWWCVLQIQFGAHQVILVRSKDEQTLSAVLPDSIRSSNALVMEVLQAKVSKAHRRTASGHLERGHLKHNWPERLLNCISVVLTTGLLPALPVLLVDFVKQGLEFQVKTPSV